MLTRLIIIIIISFPSIFTQELPKWFTNRPIAEDKFYGVGLGSLKMEGIIGALDEILSSIETKVNSSKKEFKNSNNNNFEESAIEVLTLDKLNSITGGKFSFNSTFKSYMSGGRIEEETNYASLTAELKYQDELRASALIRNYMEQSGIGEKAEALNNFEATFRNIDESELIEELESYGFSIVEFYRIENTHYVLMSFNKEKLNSVN